VLDSLKPKTGRAKQARFGKRAVASVIVAAAIAVVITAAMPFTGRTAEARQPKKPAQPNIVYVLLDDLRYDGMGFLNPNLKTPNIDWLAANGVYLPGAVVTSSLCSPSRASILTGQSMRNHHVVDNNDSSEEGLVFFPSYLQQAGYQTGFVGKWHMGRASDGPRPGFDYWVSFAGQGNFLPTDGLNAEQIARGDRNRLNVNGVHKPQAGYITTELTDYALDFLSHRDQSKPFFLYLSHKAVHQPVTPDEPYRGQYANMPFTPPVTMADTEENRAGKPMWLRNQRNSWHGVDYMYYGSEKLPDYVRRYYSTLSSVDDSLGRLIKWLRANKQLENTIIIFTSDNGFQFGEQGLIDKRTAYEASIRVPMVMYAPGLVPRGKTMPGMVRNIDLAPTLLEAAGAAAPPQFDGQSFLPLASGKVPASDWKPDLIYEYYWEWTFPQTPTTFAIVRDGWKYIQYQGLWDLEELYNLKEDPNERHNRATDPALAGRLSELRAALFKGLEARDGSHAVSFTARTSPGVVLRSSDGAGPASYPPGWMRSGPTTLTDRPTPEPQR
jgi:arylsulfatase A-like enzyme